jgi:DNA-dependent RNA polymerase auxiliary subunit epsilon
VTAPDPRLFVRKLRRDGKYAVEYVFPLSGQRLNKIISADELQRERTAGKYQVFG